MANHPMIRKVIPAAVAVALVALSGCTSGQNFDVEGAANRNPDKIEIINNVDGHPNLVRLCVDGVALLTTSHGPYASNVLRMPEWDASFCGVVK